MPIVISPVHTRKSLSRDVPVTFFLAGTCNVHFSLVKYRRNLFVNIRTYSRSQKKCPCPYYFIATQNLRLATHRRYSKTTSTYIIIKVM